MCRALILKVSIIFLIFTSSAEISLACSYGPPYSTVCENYTLADYVIVGKIQSVVPGRGDQRVSVKIEKTYKGQKLNQIVLNQPQSTCDPDFSEDVGETMLIYIVRNNQTKKFKAIAPGTGGRWSGCCMTTGRPTS